MSLPGAVEEATRAAIEHLASVLRCELLECETHLTLIVRGWNDNDSTRREIGHYLVGLRACAIDAALDIRASLEDTPEDRAELVQTVIDLVGRSNDDLTPAQKQNERNPWMAEGIWHLCMAIAGDRPELHPVGQIIAVSYPHIAASDHGLDVSAIYQDDDLFGFSLVESKAMRDSPNGAITAAVSFYREVDTGIHDPRIRQAVQIMRNSLPAEKQDMISPSLWKRKRSYLPNPHYEDCRIDWSNPRPSLRELEPENSDIVVMPHGISGFDDFFDDIADHMREFAGSLQLCMTTTRGD